MKKFCVDTNNHEGTRVVFTEKKRVQKAAKHPELNLPEFVARVKRTIEEPSMVYQDYENPQARWAYYFKENRVGSWVTYTKVVVDMRHEPHQVVTAYEDRRDGYVKVRSNNCFLVYGEDN